MKRVVAPWLSCRNVAAPIMSSASGMSSSFGNPMISIDMVVEHAWRWTPRSLDVAIISGMLGILIFFIFPFSIHVATLVIPGIIPRMLGMGIPGFPTGDIFREPTFFLFSTLRPQNVKKMCTSLPMVAAVLPIMKAGYTMSREPLERTMQTLFWATSRSGVLSFCTVTVAMQKQAFRGNKSRGAVFQRWFSWVGMRPVD